jgi:uncharacterized protein
MQAMTRRLRVRVALVAGAWLLACGRGGPEAVIHTARGPVRVTLEVAATDESRRRGLMYRSSLADGHGMLFVFPTEEQHAFWMKNTLIPLDMVFIDGKRQIVGVHPEATPLSTASIAVGHPSRYVLEVPGGYAARRGIAVGDRVELAGVPSP